MLSGHISIIKNSEKTTTTTATQFSLCRANEYMPLELAHTPKQL